MTTDRSQLVESLKWKKFPVLSAGYVCLVDCMGDDTAVTQAARVSYGEGTKQVSDDRGLIRYLMRHRHSTPLEMAEIKILVFCPMDVWRQWIRHRTASVNEYSTRYSVAIDEADKTPCDRWRIQSELNKQGSGGYISTEWPEGYMLWPCHPEDGEPYLSGVISNEEEAQAHRHWILYDRRTELEGSLLGTPLYWFDDIARDDITPGFYLSRIESDLHTESRQRYEQRVNDFKVAREQARKDLPLSTYTQAYWKCDLHNFLHFLGLRMDSHAQQEIREYATVLGEQIIKPLFPLVWEAFEDYRLNASILTGPAKVVIREMVKTGEFPASTDAFNLAISRVLPALYEQNSEGGLKPNRERGEIQAVLVGMGLMLPETL